MSAGAVAMAAALACAVGDGGGLVLRDAAGETVRVTLAADGSDCRPSYRASKEDWIVKAIVAAEDGEYWRHHGVRPLSVVRATFQNLSRGRRVSGASTITMQASRLMSPHPKTLAWKVVEAVRALKLERRHDKLWILSQYLNRAPFGANLVGVEAAAETWFGKSARELGLGEAACLAGMVQAPSRYRPDRWPKRAEARRKYVLERMLRLGLITESQKRGAESVAISANRPVRPFVHPYYCDWALRRLGERTGDVTTSLDPDVQQMCERAVGEAGATVGLSAAAVVMRVATGEVVAMACSGDYFGDSAGGQVNTATSPRPAGSTLKPFLAAMAFDRGLATPCERVSDAPRAFGEYRPVNFDGKCRGSVTVRDALVLSLNLPFVELLRRVGVEEFGATLRSLGFGSLGADDSKYGLGMAIGNVEVSLLELVAAYGAVARGGIYVEPSVTPEDASASMRRGVGVMSAEAAYLVSEMLSGDERSKASLGHVADVEVPRFAWKTGTSSAFRDAWTVAWNPQYVVGFWCGHKRGGFGDTTVVGAKAAAPGCWKIARFLCPRNDGPWFERPAGIVTRHVCAVTGLPASAGCAETETGVALAGRSAAICCRGGHSAAETRRAELEIARPADGASFRLVPGMPQQKVICQATGVAGGSRLWWFLDGTPVGESVGPSPFAIEMREGTHSLVCASSSESSAVSVTVASAVAR